ncbi:TPA: Na+/H+ antiporter NhaC family protein [Escherichia coli]
MPLVIVAIGVILLLLLMIRFKMNGFIALVLVALAVGLMQGMPLDKVIGSIKAGVGGTLGSLALIMGFGAMLGKMLADCGGAQRIATTLIAVLIAMFTFGLNRGRSMDQINDTLVSSIKIIAMMLLIIGGGGAFKQVLVDSGVDKYIASMMHETNISPLLMAWSIAAVLRIALGSATVAAITAGGIAAPLIATTGVSPELMVIAVGSGSVIFSHVNDPGFWLFKEYFNLTIGETIKSWSMLETIISVCGLVGCLLLNMVI